MVFLQVFKEILDIFRNSFVIKLVDQLAISSSKDLFCCSKQAFRAIILLRSYEKQCLKTTGIGIPPFSILSSTLGVDMRSSLVKNCDIRQRLQMQVECRSADILYIVNSFWVFRFRTGAIKSSLLHFFTFRFKKLLIKQHTLKLLLAPSEHYPISHLPHPNHFPDPLPMPSTHFPKHRSDREQHHSPCSREGNR